jgi:hypothetical protein
MVLRTLGILVKAMADAARVVGSKVADWGLEGLVGKV